MSKSQKLLAGLVGLAVVVGFVFYLTEKKGGLLGGIDNIDIRGGGPTIGQAICGATSSIAVSDLSGRTWIRITNTTGTPVFLAFATTSVTTTGYAVINQGIGLAAASGTLNYAATNYWDSGESGINWPHKITCVSNVTGSVISYIQSN